MLTRHKYCARRALHVIITTERGVRTITAGRTAKEVGQRAWRRVWCAQPQPQPQPTKGEVL